jgi:hypothetical protein
VVGVIAGPYAAFAGLLVVAGALKLGATGVSRVLGAVEIAVGAYALFVGDWLGAAAVALAYAGFTVVVFDRWRRSGPAAACECFGARPTRASPVHALVDAGAALVATAAALHPPGTLARVLAHQPVAGVPFLVASATVGYLAYVTMTATAEVVS